MLKIVSEIDYISNMDFGQMCKKEELAELLPCMFKIT